MWNGKKVFCNISCYVGVVLDHSCEEGKALDLPISLHSKPQLWPLALGRDQRNKIAYTSSQKPLLLHVERSQLMWSRHLIRMPSEYLPLEQEVAGWNIYPIRPGTTLVSPRRSCVAGDRDIWNILLRLLVTEDCLLYFECWLPCIELWILASPFQVEVPKCKTKCYRSSLIPVSIIKLNKPWTGLTYLFISAF